MVHGTYPHERTAIIGRSAQPGSYQTLGGCKAETGEEEPARDSGGG